jgi:hypothetical protein
MLVERYVGWDGIGRWNFEGGLGALVGDLDMDRVEVLEQWKVSSNAASTMSYSFSHVDSTMAVYVFATQY